MHNATRILIATITIIALSGPLGIARTEAAAAPSSSDLHPAVEWSLSIASRPSAAHFADRAGVVAFGASPGIQGRIDWAVARFDAAGLELPYVEIHVWDSTQPCDGFQATFRQSESPLRIDLCNSNRIVILHELAHAWDKSALTPDVREAFMELRGIAAWNDPAHDWRDRGVEDLADIVVWGLLTDGTGYRVEEREKLEAFRLVTGISPRNEGEATTPTAVDPGAEDYS